MRPETNEGECPQAEDGASDYLEPNQSGSGAVPGKDSWGTGFAMTESQSTQPLLDQDSSSSSSKQAQGNVRDRRSLTSALSLDAGALVKQPAIPYVNVKVSPAGVVGTGPGDGSESPFTISRHLMNEAEISC